LGLISQININVIASIEECEEVGGLSEGDHPNKDREVIPNQSH
jgi:hypothetical protein